MDRDDYNIMLKIAMYNVREKQAVGRELAEHLMGDVIEKGTGVKGVRALLGHGHTGEIGRGAENAYMRQKIRNARLIAKEGPAKVQHVPELMQRHPKLIAEDAKREATRARPGSKGLSAEEKYDNAHAHYKRIRGTGSYEDEMRAKSNLEGTRRTYLENLPPREKGEFFG